MSGPFHLDQTALQLVSEILAGRCQAGGFQVRGFSLQVSLFLTSFGLPAPLAALHSLRDACDKASVTLHPNVKLETPLACKSRAECMALVSHPIHHGSVVEAVHSCLPASGPVAVCCLRTSAMDSTVTRFQAAA